MTTLELNPIRMRPDRQGRLTPVACDFKCGFDRDDPRWSRLNLPADLFAVDYSDFEQEINQLRTYQGQSDVYVINSAGTILAPTWRRRQLDGDEMLGDNAIISSDFGGNPPYEKMREVARICTSTGSSRPTCCSSSAASQQHRHLRNLPRHGRCAARLHFSKNGPTPLTS